ncbi:MAG: MotA/TolQ/ExbB proton channel family protein [Rhizobiales bacterium]|nr:MotA/TolQ/ExbB proton channel family protein [Hyphomicrobiales bacterium]
MIETGENDRYHAVQGWWLLACLILLALYIAHDRGYLALMLATDKSYISPVIMLAFLIASLHAAWNIFLMDMRIEKAKAEISSRSGEAIHRLVRTPERRARLRDSQEIVAHYIADLERLRRGHAADGAAREGALVLDVLADCLRNPGETGWYLVDILTRLGLIGTIIGFVIVLSALSDGPAPTGDNIQILLIAMSGGMGIALYTTLAGLICASLLGAQHMILSRATEQLIALLIRLKAEVLKAEVLGNPGARLSGKRQS